MSSGPFCLRRWLGADVFVKAVFVKAIWRAVCARDVRLKSLVI
jgi:hypothetical protein